MVHWGSKQEHLAHIEYIWCSFLSNGNSVGQRSAGSRGGSADIITGSSLEWQLTEAELSVYGL